MKEKYKNYLNKDHSFDRITMVGIFCLIIVIAGMFGFLYEFIFYYFDRGMKYFYYRGGNFLPWINIYAIGAIIVYLFTYKIRKKPGMLFIISLVTCGLLEYVSGLCIYIIGNGLRYWNYNTEILNFGNIQGFVCLRSVLFFGISSLFLMYVIVPGCFYLAKKLPSNMFLIISITLCSIILIDEFYNLLIARMFDLPRARDFYLKLGVKYISVKQG